MTFIKESNLYLNVNINKNCNIKILKVIIILVIISIINSLFMKNYKNFCMLFLKFKKITLCEDLMEFIINIKLFIVSIILIKYFTNFILKYLIKYYLINI